jgi:hypothetical protein
MHWSKYVTSTLPTFKYEPLTVKRRGSNETTKETISMIIIAYGKHSPGAFTLSPELEPQQEESRWGEVLH